MGIACIARVAAEIGEYDIVRTGLGEPAILAGIVGVPLEAGEAYLISPWIDR